jgi:hypothetical protein
VTRLLRRAALVLLVVGVAALVAFLYFVPPLLSVAPEDFSGPQNDAAPAVTDIADPAERLIAERGRYLVVTGGCIGCHHVPTSQGPDFSRYLAGGLKFQSAHGTYVSANLTPDPATGLGKRSDAEVKRVLRSGVSPDGRVMSYRLMPWGGYTAWTEEDIHAVVVYLRHLRAVVHTIPAPAPAAPMSAPTAVGEVYAGRNYGTPE